MSGQPTVVDYFIIECDRSFGFLVAEYGFSAPSVETEPGVVIVSFYKGEIAVECVLDKRDEDASVMIVHLVDGKKPPVYRVNEKRQVVREYLSMLLTLRGVKEITYEEPEGYRKMPRAQALFRKSLTGDARLLREHGGDILAGSAAIFDQAYPNGALYGDLF
jgi:hypothetical protein